jgi:hypothetical protein
MNSIDIDFDAMVPRVAKTKHGFGDIKLAAEEVVAQHTARDALVFAKTLYTSDIAADPHNGDLHLRDACVDVEAGVAIHAADDQPRRRLARAGNSGSGL